MNRRQALDKIHNAIWHSVCWEPQDAKSVIRRSFTVSLLIQHPIYKAWLVEALKPANEYAEKFSDNVSCY